MNIEEVMKKASKQSRKMLEAIYFDLCDIIEYQDVYNDVTKQTKKQEVVVHEKQRCRLSYKTSLNNNETDTGATKQQAIELFISPDIRIKAGSKIIVTRNGTTIAYKNSGEPMIYDSHQAINLELFDKWS